MKQNIEPIIFSIPLFKGFQLDLRYYGLIYVLGFFIVQYCLKKRDSEGYFINPLGKENVEKYISFSILWVVAGARVFEILFYEPSYYFSHPLKMLAVWEGGLSFHGGLLAVVLYSIYFCRKHQIPFLLFSDALALPASIALALGRIANFINGELYGIPVSNQINPPWFAVLFQKTDPTQLYRYPTQLFETLDSLLIFVILKVLLSLKKAQRLTYSIGFPSFSFLLLYSLFRFIIEFYKDVARDTFLGMSTGQLLCIPMFFIALYYLCFKMSIARS